MNTQKSAGVKRSACESQASSASYCAVTVSASASQGQTSSGEGTAGSGGGSATGEVDEEEEPSSSSLTENWCIAKENNLSRAKRFKHTLANKRENASEEVNTDHSEETVQINGNLKEYCRISDKQLREAVCIANSKGGECVSKITMGVGNLLAFKCKFGHIFRSTLNAAEQEWCNICTNYYAQCVEFAKKNNGKLLDKILSTKVHFECARNHTFTCKTYKSRDLKWCTLCKEIDEEEKKKQDADRKAKDIEEKSKEQEKLFEEAKKLMEEEAAAKAAQEAAQYQMYIDQVARQQAKKESATGKVTEVESYWVNLVLLTPYDYMVSKMKMIEKAQRDTYYRKMAVVLHPDKNKHPNATYAFTKLKQIFIIQNSV